MNELHAPQSFFSGDNVTIMICLGIVVTAILIMVFFTYIIEREKGLKIARIEPESRIRVAEIEAESAIKVAQIEASGDVRVAELEASRTLETASGKEATS